LFYQGAGYVSGFNITANSSGLSIGSGTLSLLLKTVSSSGSLSVSEDGFFYTLYNGTFVESSDLSSFSEYADGTPISSNKYFNIVWGIVPVNDTGVRLMAVVQDYPGSGNEYTSGVRAEIDKFLKTNYFPSNTFLKRLFLPIARTVLKEGSSSFVALESGGYFLDVRGRVAGSGSAPSPPLTDHAALDNLDYASSGHTGFASSASLLSIGNWSADKGSYWNTSTDLDTVISDDEISESKIAFSTSCGSGNHLYISGNDLACEADSDTTYSAGGTLLQLVGTIFSVKEGTLTDGKACTYSSASGLVCNSDFTTDTYNTTAEIRAAVNDSGLTYAFSISGNAATATVLAANGANCPAGQYPLGVDASGAVEDCTADSDTTYSAGGTLLDLTGTTFSLKEGALTNGKACTYSSTSGLVCNSDFTTDTNAGTLCSGTTTYLDGEGNCDDISGVYVNAAGDSMSGALNLSGNNLELGYGSVVRENSTHWCIGNCP